MKKIALSRLCKDAGLTGLSELSEVTGVSNQTLINWHKNKSKKALIEVVIAGAVSNRLSEVEENSTL